MNHTTDARTFPHARDYLMGASETGRKSQNSIGNVGSMSMPRGDKSKYTDKQERQADHIAEGYEQRGVPEEEAERRAWATVNKDDGGGKKSGSGRGVETGHPAAHKGGRIGGNAAASRPAAARSASAKKAAATRARE